MTVERIEPTPKLLQMQEDVEKIGKEIRKLCKSNEKLNNLYQGCRIWFSPLYKNPNILFFGMNHSGEWGGDWDRYKPQDDEPKGNKFYEKMRKCFKKIQKEELLKNMVITNRYFFGTNTFKELEEDFFNLLIEMKSVDYRNMIKNKQIEWVKTIIEELSPKLIVVGGFNLIYKFVDKVLYNEEIIELEKGKYQYIKVYNINGIKTIFYTRNRKIKKDKVEKELISILDTYTQSPNFIQRDNK